MGTEDLDDLLKRMPEIAAAVNAFASEAIQREAFEVLVAAYAGKHRSRPQGPSPEKMVGSRAEDDVAAPASPPLDPEPSPETKKPRRSPSSRPREGFKPIRGLDLHPVGKTSLAAFDEEKKPSTDSERVTLAVYWFAEIAGIQPITMDHIGTAFKMIPQWKEPTNLRSAITNTVSRLVTIDSADLQDIKIVPQGRSYVEHKLPKHQKKK